MISKMIRSISFTLGAVVIGVTSGVAVYFLWRRRSRRNAIRCVVERDKVFVVCTSQQWDQAYKFLAEDLQTLKVLGFDCEWVNENGKAKPVSLLQFASVSNVCVLVRLSILAQRGIPESLKQLLADRSILKVGVASLDDAKRLEHDFFVRCEGCIDLRNVALRSRLALKRNGLKSLAKEILGIELDKDFGIRTSNWEADVLTEEQIRYGAQDALAAIYIFLSLIKSKTLRTNGQLLDEQDIHKRVGSFCQGLIDLKYSPKSKNKEVSSAKVSRSETGKSFVSDYSRAYVTRKKPLYHNCQLISPDGQVLCTCDLKKAVWYLEKNLGVKVCEEPLKIQLKFEPAGRPLDENNYYLQQKDNVCVVCGKSDSYIRKNVIPHEYRKHFPPIMKEHKSHDVVLMCTSCHMTSNRFDGVLKQKLAQMYSAEQTSSKHVYNSELLKVKSAAKALLQCSSQIPQQRLKELEQVIKDHYGVPVVDNALLERAVNLETKFRNDDFCEHGHMVVQYVIEHEGLLNFERMWRQHFLDTMSPAFLPTLWSVDHSHDELINMDIEMKCSITTDVV